MAAAAVDDHLTLELECTICKDEYREPVELRCGHDFCRECLVVYVERIGSSSWQCPICRQDCNMSVDMIKRMNVNLKLRNIIEALNNSKKPVSVCADHNKPYDIYCEDCKAVKCVTCFMRLCKAGHTTFELDLVAEELRNSVHAKLKQCSEVDDELKAKRFALGTKCELSSLVRSINDLLKKALLRNHKEMVEVKDRLTAFDRKTSDQLVHAKEEINSVEVKLPFDTDDIYQVLQEAQSKLIAAEDMLIALVDGDTDSDDESSDVSPVEDIVRPVPAPRNDITIDPLVHRSPDAGSNGARSPIISAESNPGIRNGAQQQRETRGEGDIVADIGDTSNPSRWADRRRATEPRNAERNGFQLLHDILQPFLSYNPLSDALELDRYPIGMSPTYSTSDDSYDERFGSRLQPTIVEFGAALVESVARIGNKLYACTSDGIFLVNGETKSLQLPGLHVTSCCAIDQSCALVSTKTEVIVYNMQPYAFCSVRYTLPNTWVGTYIIQIVSLGVSSAFPVFFFMADVNNACIHVWNANEAHWQPPMTTDRYVTSPNPSFRMVVHQGVMYLSFHREGIVYATDLNGTALWSHRTHLCKPNGLHVTNSYVYVCDLSERLVKLTLGGQFERCLLGDDLNQAWSVAVVGDKIAVVERYFRHNTQRTPVRLLQFSMNAVSNAYEL